jgi:hypothetical protein
MDWIERLFGISPDGGNGSTEALFLIATAAIAVLVITYRVKASKRAR